ncbi:MAG TPA: chromosome partitioning protein ParA [Acidimicrobiaceae bacterium]|nr:chromosome partitioning protein ParA [Acidimicrobiaceae bacterium]HCB37538.1 chromosome partitioning protein ParA [Acidimicrobiaceae bacterium]
MTRVLAIANQKGGVGKTTTAVNISAAMAVDGLRTLLVDLDPQGNATTGVGVDPRSPNPSMYQVLVEDAPIADVITATDIDGLYVAPSRMELAGAELELVAAFSRETKLRNALGSVRGQYDFVVIDCPPSLGLLTVNGLTAAEELVIPVQCEYYSLEGLGQLLHNVDLVKQSLNPGLATTAIVLVMFDARTKLAQQVADEVRAHFGDTVCRIVIPRSVRVTEAPSHGMPVITYDRSSRGAVAYRLLAQEIVSRRPHPETGGTAQ